MRVEGFVVWMGDMAELAVGADRIEYSARGSGPAVLVPMCNFPMLDMPYINALTAHFTVVGASPRGYQGSTRLGSERSYTGDLLAADLLAVCDELGFDTFSVFGYSLTAAMSAWLASQTSRVNAVIAGGFPLMGAYERVLMGAECEAASLAEDAERADELQRDFDVRAVLSFYRMLATLPDGALVADLRCPLLAFWGTDDDVLWSFNTVPDLTASLADHGVGSRQLIGRDHVSAIASLGDIIEGLVEWLIAQRGAMPGV